MDLSITDSKVLSGIVLDTLKKTIGEEDANKIHGMLLFKNDKSNNLVHALSDVLTNMGYHMKIKDVLERLTESLSNKLAVNVIPEHVELPKMSSQDVFIEIMNKFDVPLVFEVFLDDRDNFMQVIYDKREDAFFNTLSVENIVDTGAISRFKFKLGRTDRAGSNGTTLFVIIRSKDIEGLNWVGKLKVLFIEPEQVINKEITN